jgi:hypothetical protein
MSTIDFTAGSAELKETARELLHMAQRVNPGLSLLAHLRVTRDALRALSPRGLTFEGVRRMDTALAEVVEEEGLAQ